MLLPELHELFVAEGFKLIKVFAICCQPLRNSELKGQVSIRGRVLHYFKNFSGNISLNTIGL